MSLRRRRTRNERLFNMAFNLCGQRRDLLYHGFTREAAGQGAQRADRAVDEKQAVTCILSKKMHVMKGYDKW